MVYLAETGGFEPPEAFTSTVFKTAAFNHSATSPCYENDLISILKDNAIYNSAKSRTGV